jgi:hypothetical protein
MSIDAPPAPPAAPPASSRSTSATSGSGTQASKHGKRTYVVFEEKSDGSIVRAGEQEAATPDDANWQLVETPDTDLNKRAKSDDAKQHPKLLALAKSGVEFQTYKLAVETVVKRAPAKAKRK